MLTKISTGLISFLVVLLIPTIAGGLALTPPAPALIHPRRGRARARSTGLVQRRHLSVVPNRKPPVLCTPPVARV